jgi:hypothetical protein
VFVFAAVIRQPVDFQGKRLGLQRLDDKIQLDLLEQPINTDQKSTSRLQLATSTMWKQSALFRCAAVNDL